MSKPNISPEIEAAIAEGREIGLREAASYVAGLKQIFVPWIVRGLGDVPETDAEGWGDLSSKQKDMLAKVARGIERLIRHDPPPPHTTHIWSQGDDPICAVCGERKAVIESA